MSLGIGSIVSVGGGTSSSGGGGSSGIFFINGQPGPAVVIVGVNGIDVTASGNLITIDGAGASGVSTSSISGVSKFATSFTGVSGLISHFIGSLDVIVSIYSSSSGGTMKAIIPDKIIVENNNEISVIFNRLVTNYRIVIIG